MQKAQLTKLLNKAAKVTRHHRHICLWCGWDYPTLIGLALHYEANHQGDTHA